MEVRFHPLRRVDGAVSVRDVRFQFISPKVYSLVRFHLSRLLLQRLSRRTVTATPPGGAQSLVLLQLGCSPPCSTLPSGCVADLCRSSDSSCEWGNFRSPKISNLPFHFTLPISGVCDQHFARFEQAGWQGSQRVSEDALHHSLRSGTLPLGGGSK